MKQTDLKRRGIVPIFMAAMLFLIALNQAASIKSARVLPDDKPKSGSSYGDPFSGGSSHP